MSKVGVYSGTFDPIHNGHLSFALAAIEAAGLDKVYFLVEPLPWRKANVTDLAARLEMAKIALSGHHNLDILTLGLNENVSVSNTLGPLLERLDGSELYLLLGQDVWEHAPEWSGFDDLKNAVKFVVGQRSGPSPTHSIAPDVEIKTEHSHVASTKIRQTKAPDNVPAGVKEYIVANNLYV